MYVLKKLISYSIVHKETILDARCNPHTFPIRSELLKVNISNTGIHVFRLQEIISVSIPGYSDNVTQ